VENTEEEIITKDMLKIMKDELMNLPDDHKEILILRDIDGLSYNEIADILGISLANVKVRIHRGRELLKTRLQTKGVL
jgi:RNA polymerase sigma-70 factor (ECF subfamily)